MHSHVLILAAQYHGPGGAERYTRLFTRAIIDLIGSSNVAIWSLRAGQAGDPVGEDSYLGHATLRSGIAGKVWFAVRAASLARRCRMIVASHVALAPVAALLSRWFRIPYVVLAYGIEVWSPLSRLHTQALKAAKAVVAISEFTKQRVVETHRADPGRVVVIPPVVDPALLVAAGRAPVAAGTRPTVLTVARLAADEGYKGCDTLIQALPRVHDAVGDLTYVIAGSGDDRPRLEALAARVGVTDSVRFAGRVDERELAELYGSCDVFAMPSRAGRRNGRVIGEGFGIVFIEAAAFGKPVIAGRGDGSAEAVQDGTTGILVDADRIDSVAGALTLLLTDAGLRARMGAAARQRILAHFTYARLQSQVRDLVGLVMR